MNRARLSLFQVQRCSAYT